MLYLRSLQLGHFEIGKQYKLAFRSSINQKDQHFKKHGTQKHERTTQHRQQTGLDNLTSAVVRYQPWFGAGPLRLSF